MIIEYECRVFPPCAEEPVGKAGSGYPLEIHGRNDLIRIHIGATERDCGTGVNGELFH
jgi:hypothetical protein